MQLGEFLKAYRDGVSAYNGGKSLSVAKFAAMIGIDADNIRNWERGYSPREESYQNQLKSYFNIESLVDIPNTKLTDALNKFGSTKNIPTSTPPDLANDPNFTEHKVKILTAEDPTWDFSIDDFVDLPKTAHPKMSQSKEILVLGKEMYHRLKPEEYAAAFEGWSGLPMYNMPITASFIETYRDEKMFRPSYYLHDPRFKDCNFGAIVTGDSMFPEIRHGDFVICQEVVDKRFVVFGDIYYIVASNGLETCKYVNKDPENKDNLLLKARNDSIDPSPIPKDMLRGLYKVKGLLRGY